MAGGLTCTRWTFLADIVLAEAARDLSVLQRKPRRGRVCMYYSAPLVYAYYIYFFSSGGGGGGGTGLNSSGRLGAVPSPICSQGESESKFRKA